jgi:hypothetical protein
MSSGPRYYIDQIAIGDFLVLDSVDGGIICVCPYDFETNAPADMIEGEALERALAVAFGLNAIGYCRRISKAIES